MPFGHNTKTEIILSLPSSSMERLTALKVKTQADNYAEGAANALRLYEAFVDESEKESEFFIKRKDAEIEPYRLWE